MRRCIRGSLCDGQNLGRNGARKTSDNSLTSECRTSAQRSAAHFLPRYPPPLAPEAPFPQVVSREHKRISKTIPAPTALLFSLFCLWWHALSYRDLDHSSCGIISTLLFMANHAKSTGLTCNR